VATEIADPKRDLRAKCNIYDFEAVFTRQFKRKLPSAKPEKNLQKKLHRNLDAATPIRFTMTNCNKLKKYARSRSTKKP
jgi:hypothetical protein